MRCPRGSGALRQLCPKGVFLPGIGAHYNLFHCQTTMCQQPRECLWPHYPCSCMRAALVDVLHLSGSCCHSAPDFCASLHKKNWELDRALHVYNLLVTLAGVADCVFVFVVVVVGWVWCNVLRVIMFIVRLVSYLYWYCLHCCWLCHPPSQCALSHECIHLRTLRFFLGSYRFLYILNWIYHYMTEMWVFGSCVYSICRKCSITIHSPVTEVSIIAESLTRQRFPTW